MTLLEQTRVLLDEASAGVFWPDQHLYDALNHTLLTTIPTLPTERLTRVSWVVDAGADRVAIPSTIMIPKWVEDSERQFFVTTRAQIERYKWDWKGSTPGIPQHFVLLDCGWIQPYPRADENYQYTLVGLPWPTEIGSSEDDVDGPLRLREGIAYRAASGLLDYTQPTLAQSYQAHADEAIAEFKRQSRNQHSHNIRRLKPASKFGVGQHGNIRNGQGW